jgi:hypothetical protein
MLRMNFGIAVYLCRYDERRIRRGEIRENAIPEVLVIRNRAFVLFAKPSILSVPMNDVLMVLTALN